MRLVNGAPKPLSIMRTCPECGHANREGLYYCEECGANLDSQILSTTLPTRRIEDPNLAPTAKATWGTARFGQDSTVILKLKESETEFTLAPITRVVIGRVDNNSPKKPDIDLSKHGALEKGVSRVHAAIERSEDTLLLVDMGSSNGTYLNGQRLTPNQPRILRDGDEIRFGRLVAHIHFK